MRRSEASLLLLVVGTLLLACSGPGRGIPPTPVLPRLLHIVGATDMAPQVDAIRARAATLSPPVEVRYTPTDTDTGVRLLAEGRADVALASWLPDGPPPGLTAIPLGQADIAVVTHPAAGVEALDMETLRRVFEGRYLSWEEVGGADVPIRLVSREAGSGTRAAFETLVMGEARVALTAVVMPSGKAVVDYVARHEGAIGYVAAPLVGQKARVTVLRVDDLHPGDADYPLRRALFALVREDAPRWVVELLTSNGGD